MMLNLLVEEYKVARVGIAELDTMVEQALDNAIFLKYMIMVRLQTTYFCRIMGKDRLKSQDEEDVAVLEYVKFLTLKAGKFDRVIESLKSEVKSLEKTNRGKWLSLGFDYPYKDIIPHDLTSQSF